jgi:LPXTG-motif cell wall-anchored protein
MVVNLERERFNLRQAVFKAPMPELSMVTIEPKFARTISLDPEPKGKLSTGPSRAYIAVGAALLLLGVIAGLWFWRKRWHCQKATK